MKTIIPAIEKAIAGEIKTVEELGMNLTLFWAYKKSKYAGNDIINFYDVIWNKDIDEIAKNLKDNGVTEFSVSSNFSGLIITLAEFEKHGFTMAGIIDVTETYTDLKTNKPAVAKAVRMVLK